MTTHQQQPSVEDDGGATEAFHIPQQRSYQGPQAPLSPPPFQQQGGPPQPPKKRRRWLWVLGGIVALIVVISAANHGGSTTAPAASTAPSASASAPAAGGQSAAPAPAPATPPKVYTGKGDDVVKIDKSAGPAILTFACPKCSGNTIVQSNGADPLLVNTIDSYTGKKAIDVTDGSTTSELTIKATGSWKVTVGGLDQAKQATGDAPITGKGDDVIMLSGDTTTAAITNKGGANFIVQDTPADGGFPDLAVNTIGSYTGTVQLSAPALVQVTSVGTWSITPGS
ncbi:MAG TPA: hypothetical protein VGH76_04500 [Actinomycetospora sp.]|jgi:hypothetical protein|uniref:hypothetical protein n=1 Tax=Actinomycetospora sp. TaxID=1872135 RepID=UPI002F42E95E